MWRSSAVLILALVTGPAAFSMMPGSGSQSLVRIYVTVIGAENRPVKGLKKEDFTVNSNGEPQPIVSFSDAAQPLTATLMLDMSNAGLEQLEQLQQAGTAFVDALGAEDRARIGTFGAEIFTSPVLTSDKTSLMRVLREELWPGGPTPLWPGIDAAISSLSGEAGRRVVIVFTDGSDYVAAPNRPTRSAVESRVVQEGVIVYTVTYRGFVFDFGVRAIASLSGGRNFELPLDADLGGIFTRIVTELRQQYVLEFSVPSDGDVHPLDVRVTQPGLTAITKTSYVAK